MTLYTFLLDHNPLMAVDLLPDSRLINVVIGDNVIYGVNVADIPPNVTLTRIAATYEAPTVIAGLLMFDARDYVMLNVDLAKVQV